MAHELVGVVREVKRWHWRRELNTRRIKGEARHGVTVHDGVRRNATQRNATITQRNNDGTHRFESGCILLHLLVEPGKVGVALPQPSSRTLLERFVTVGLASHLNLLVNKRAVVLHFRLMLDVHLFAEVLNNPTLELHVALGRVWIAHAGDFVEGPAGRGIGNNDRLAEGEVLANVLLEAQLRTDINGNCPVAVLVGHLSGGGGGAVGAAVVVAVVVVVVAVVVAVAVVAVVVEFVVVVVAAAAAAAGAVVMVVVVVVVVCTSPRSFRESPYSDAFMVASQLHSPGQPFSPTKLFAPTIPTRLATTAPTNRAARPRGNV